MSIFSFRFPEMVVIDADAISLAEEKLQRYRENASPGNVVTATLYYQTAGEEAMRLVNNFEPE